MDQVLLRRIMGTAAAVLAIGLGYVGLESRYAPAADTYEVTAMLGDAGSGLRAGNDIKLRGAVVGEVAGLLYDNGRAKAVLRLDDDPKLPPPDQLDLFVTSKSLLGEKQIELEIPAGSLPDQGPFLAPGDTLEQTREPTELSEVLSALTPVLRAVDGRDLADIVEALSQQSGEGERIAENLELGQRLAAFGDRTAEANLDNLRDLADISEALAPVADDFNRLNDTLPGATEVLRTQQSEISANLDALSRFATGFAELLEADEALIGELLESGDVVGAVLERNADDIGGLIDGLHLYTKSLGRGGALLTDRTEWAGFRILLDMSAIDLEGFLCHETDDQLPFCAEDGSSSDGSGPGTELGELEFVVPERDESSGGAS